MVHFRKVESLSTNAALPGRDSRCIKLAVGEIRIAATIAEDAITIAPFALVK
jgi:hypothetical protein